MKQLKDYLHLYLGCEIMDFYNDKVGVLNGIITMDEGIKICVLHKTTWHLNIDEVKLILRPLSDILKVLTIEQKRQLLDAGLMYSHAGDQYTIWTPEATRLACSFGIDVFGLIEAGLAIDKTTLTSK